VNEAITLPDFVPLSDTRAQTLIGIFLGIIIMVSLEFGGPESLTAMCEKSSFINCHYQRLR
jgi:hypothetical protein